MNGFSFKLLSQQVNCNYTEMILTLILYPATLLKMFIRSMSLGSFKYRIMPCVNKGNLTSSLTICIPFIPFSYLIALDKAILRVKRVKDENTCL